MTTRYVSIKRLLDRLLALLMVFPLSPLFVLIALLIKLESKGPVIFTQKRVGIHKTHFKIYKFRTMRMDTPKNKPTHLLDKPEQWLTNVGRLLRKTSLDELPQLLNIIKGEMSFIGPRPALWNQYDLIDERDLYNVHEAYPGITGWAQISGRDLLTIPQKAQLDGEYIKHMGLFIDLKILIKTIVAIVKKDGIQEGGTKEVSHHENTHNR